MAERVLVAGATGTLGSEIVRELKRHNYRVRALGRDPLRIERLRGCADELTVADILRSPDLRPVCDGVDQVVSCVGASVIPSLRRGRAPFTCVDTPANRRLIESARSAGVRRFVYVSVFTGGRLQDNGFVRGHEDAVAVLRESAMDYAVVRPTAFFSSLVRIMREPSWGLLPETRFGAARTNPIHENDLAAFCVSLVQSRESGIERDVGGPDVLTRRRIAALVLGRTGRSRPHIRVPIATLRCASFALMPLNRRVSCLMDFIAYILSEDFIAPLYGSRRLAEYVADCAAH